MKTMNERKEFNPIPVVEKYYGKQQINGKNLNQCQWQKNITEITNQRKEFKSIPTAGKIL
jgi:hypothetical protein